MTEDDGIKRCEWPTGDPLMIEYHDIEWGVPVHDDRKIFEFMVLDAFQAGLSWQIILKKREGFRKAFANFEPKKVAEFDEGRIEELREDAGIIRNRLKIASTVGNARSFLDIQEEYGSFDAYIWKFVGDSPIVNEWKRMSEIPATSLESDAMAKDLKKRGFKFAGSTICYAFMQAAGMVNDHTVDCFRYREIIDSY